MSMQAITYALTLPVEDSGPRLLLIIVAHHVNYRTGDMFVGQDVLAAEVKRDERTVRRYLNALEEAGFIRRSELRAPTGHRMPDRIELLGYLEWQSVIENGGTIRDPKTLGKPVITPPDKTSGRGLATGQNDAGLPDKNASTTGHLMSGARTTKDNQKITTGAPERACVKGARAPVARCAPTFVLTPADPSWGHWMALLSDRDRRDLVAAAEASESIVTGSRWPTETSALPKVDRGAVIEKHKLGDAA